MNGLRSTPEADRGDLIDVATNQGCSRQLVRCCWETYVVHTGSGVHRRDDLFVYSMGQIMECGVNKWLPMAQSDECGVGEVWVSNTCEAPVLVLLVWILVGWESRRAE